jgi:long-subunit fatty acid transport protein
MYSRINGNVQQKGTVREGGGMNSWSFGGAIDVAPNLSIGITLNFFSGSYTYDREYSEIDSKNFYTVFPNDFNYWTYTNTIKSDLSGFNALFGLMYRSPGKYKIGATVRIPTTYEISETFTDDGFSEFDNGETRSASNVGETKYKVVTPLVISGGISVQPIDWLLLAGDAEYTDWTQMEFDTDNSDLLDENRLIKKSMRETWNLRGGAEVSIWQIGLKLRAGIEWKPSPWKDDKTENDQMNYTTGIGFMLDESSMVNASYSYGSWKTFRNNYTLNSSIISRTSEELVKTQTISLTFSHRF